ncbi:MAG: HD domain-containing protein, partial [Dehalococcoidia bacterium]|nr:HD domain-containing protein [Dehalococcoidia bacterium]
SDVDLVVSAPALPLARELAPYLRGHFVSLHQEHQVARVVLTSGGDVSGAPKGWQLDLATATGEIEQDLAQRDFTVNAVAVCLGGGEAIDPVGGLADLERRSIRAVSRGVFQDDAARLLRAVRLAGELGFQVEESTAAHIGSDAHLLGGVAGERLREELMRLLTVPVAAPGVRSMDRLGLLSSLLPELDAARGVEQPKEHHWDVFQHSVETVAAADFLMGDGVGFPVWARHSFPWSQEVANRIEEGVAGFPRRALFKLTCLLHDIAKPQTKALQPDGSTRFLGHSLQGARASLHALGRLRFSRREAEMVSAMIIHHLRPTQMSHEEMPTRRAIFRFFRDTGEVAEDVLYLSLADHLASRGPELVPEGWCYHTKVVAHVLQQRLLTEAVPLPRLLTGHDIMAAFGIESGPRVGRLLEIVEEARAAGEVYTRKQAMELVRKELGE